MYKAQMLEQIFLSEIDRVLERVFEKAVKKAWLEGDRAALQQYQRMLNEVRRGTSNGNTSTDKH